MADWADEVAEEIINVIGNRITDTERDWLAAKLRVVEGQGCIRGIEACSRATDEVFKRPLSDGKQS